MSKKKECTIVWFRRDLRLEDNPALSAAVRIGPILPVFIWSPEEEGQFQPGRVSRWWLKQSLIQLDASLSALGASLIMRRSNDSLSALLQLIEVTGADKVYYNHLYDPMSLVRDHRVKQGLSQRGIQVNSFNGDLLYEPWEVQDEGGEPFTRFESYWEKCLHMPFEPDCPLLPPRQLTPVSGKQISSCTPDELGLEDDTEKSSNALLARAWMPGWSHADKAFESFLSGLLVEYSRCKHKIDGPTTSFLSPHLHFGEISVRKVYHSVRRKQIQWSKEGPLYAEESINLFLRSIGFREYSRYLSFNFPFTHERPLLSNLKSFPWRADEVFFKAWRQGRTGYPLVDAGMRELWATGWLHNRVRVIVSSFCVKFLQLPWRWGMKYFWDTLLDADLECDVLGWQYIAGSLPDGHELDRMDNPQTVGYTYDPHGEYVRQWLPELTRLPTEWIHHPWDAPPSVLRAAGVELGSNYPRPIVEVVSARERLHQAMTEMWEQGEALRAAGLQGDGGMVKEKSMIISEQPFVSLQRPPKFVENLLLRASGGPQVESACSSASLSASPHWDQTVPTCAKQMKMSCDTLSSPRGLNAMAAVETNASSRANSTSPSLASTTNDAFHKTHDSPDIHGMLLGKNQVTRLGYTPPPSRTSDEMSTAESTSSPKKVAENRCEERLLWVPTIRHQSPSSSFGCVPSDNVTKLRNTDFLVENRGLQEKVESGMQAPQTLKRKYNRT